jgi:hypothetical protein
LQAPTFLRALVAIAASFALLQSAQADVILSAQSVVSAPSAITVYTFDRTIDQSGLSVNYLSGVTDFASYTSSDPIHAQGDQPPTYAAANVASPFNVDYALGGTYGVNQLALWNYPFPTSGGLHSFEVYTSGDAGFAASTLVGSFIALDDGTLLNHVQVFDLADTNAAFVRIHSLSTRQNGFAGFSEVAFGVNAVSSDLPEPGVPALALIGLLAAVLARRTRAG